MIQLVLEEQMKLAYRLSDWPRFFALAHFLRMNWPAEYQQHRMNLLEALALLRHCQSQKLETLAANAPQSQNTSFEQILALSKTHFSAKTATTQETHKIRSHLEGKSLWPTSSKNVKNIDPRRVRIFVENLCTS